MKSLLVYLKRKFSNILTQNDWFYLLPLFFGLSLLPFRLSFIFGLSFETRCLLAVFCLTVFFVFKKTVIPYCLNSKLLQSLFQLALEIDDLRLELKFQLDNYPERFWNSFFYLLGFYISYVQFPLYLLYALFNDALMAVVIYLILYTQYLILRRIFLTPLYDFSGSDQILSPALVNLQKTLRLEWKDIVANMNFVTLHFFSKPVTNRLPEKVLKHSYTFLGIRFISKTPSNSTLYEAFTKLTGALKAGARAAIESGSGTQTRSWTANEKFISVATTGTLAATGTAAYYTKQQAYYTKQQAEEAARSNELQSMSNELQRMSQEQTAAYHRDKLAEMQKTNRRREDVEYAEYLRGRRQDFPKDSVEQKQIDATIDSVVPVVKRIPKEHKGSKALSICNEDTLFEITLKKIKSLLFFIFF